MDAVENGDRRPICEVDRVLFVPASLSSCGVPPNMAAVGRRFDYRLKSNKGYV